MRDSNWRCGRGARATDLRRPGRRGVRIRCSSALAVGCWGAEGKGLASSLRQASGTAFPARRHGEHQPFTKTLPYLIVRGLTVLSGAPGLRGETGSWRTTEASVGLLVS